MRRTYFDFWRAITFWIFADMAGVCTVCCLWRGRLVVSWFRQSSEYVGMFQQHQALEVGGAASSCVQRQQTLK
jgi:hypothetical protein